ncbi:hypothetical protein MM213_20365 [Belliella sp. R4-6]|uniref:Uncharacterized protein n=1 Tax=Belliella alkalica TaxID=1730871 RepID=A0ABS9VHE9_9BACT|nr:hypothetical protein [Belliella alkalica]MCH7415866.1 hypothetical protein [Belliella alkalica]
MVRLTVVNITGILTLDYINLHLTGWSTSSEKSGQHHRNRWSRWFGIYSQDLQILELEKNQLTISTVNILSQYITSIEKAIDASEKNVVYFTKRRFGR